jgi:hypothetical protein
MEAIIPKHGVSLKLVEEKRNPLTDAQHTYKSTQYK